MAPSYYSNSLSPLKGQRVINRHDGQGLAVSRGFSTVGSLQLVLRII